MGRDPQYDQYKKHKSSLLKPVRHGLEIVVLWCFKTLVAWLPMSFNRFLGRLLGKLGYYLASKDRKIALYQLEFALGELSLKQRKKIAKQAFENVGQTAIETLCKSRIDKQSQKLIRLENEQVISDALAENKGLVLCFIHSGNWEILNTVYDRLDLRGTVIQSSLKVEKLNRMLKQSRQNPRLTIIGRGDKASGRAILSCFRNNEAYLLSMDQDSPVNSVFVDFFGRSASTPTAAAIMAQRFGAPVVLALTIREPKGHHCIRFELLSKGPYQGGEAETLRLTQAYTKVIEFHIRHYPNQWVWFHRRWKTQPSQDNAPESEPKIKP